MRVQILASDHKSGKSKKTGNDYDMHVCQVVVHLDEGAPFVGELTLPKDHPECKPGVYTPAFRMIRTPDGKIMGAIAKLTAIPAPKV